MIKNILLITLLMTGSTLFAANDGAKKNKKMMVQDLVTIPFPGGKMFKKGKIKLSDAQKADFATNVRPIMHQKYNPLIQQIFLLEKSIQRQIKKRDTIFDARLQDKIDNLTTLKQAAIEYKIEAVTKIKTILTKEQWQVWISN